MSFWKALFGGGDQSILSDVIDLKPGRGWTFDPVGESHYQAALTKIAGRKSAQAARFECSAMLIIGSYQGEPAIEVHTSAGRVASVSRTDLSQILMELAGVSQTAVRFRCKAKIVGGWLSEESEGDYGIKLRLARPLKAQV